MIQAVKPMLAVAPDWNLLRDMKLMMASPKIDGVRCIVSGGVAWSRTWKPFPNRSVQERVREAAWVLEGMDGELVVGSPADREVFARTMSGVMSQEGDPDVRFLVFDMVNMPYAQYHDRYSALSEREKSLPSWVSILQQEPVSGLGQVDELEEHFLGQGYEGLILRHPYKLYKHGRATARSQELLKVKRYADAEAVVTGSEELMHNGNEAFTDVQGHAKRSSCQAGLVPSGMLGALNVVLMSDPQVRFSIGTGFDAALRESLWKERDALPGRVVKFRHMPHGALESTGVPRHPVFLGFRDPSDI